MIQNERWEGENEIEYRTPNDELKEKENAESWKQLIFVILSAVSPDSLAGWS